jgi:flagellar assembly protein FliH
LSSIIKAPFVSFLDQKKEIKVIETSNSKIINSSSNDNKVDNSNMYIENEIKETSEQMAAILEAEEECKNKIKNAQIEAEEIISVALEEANQLKDNAYNEGKSLGYEDGKNEYVKEIEQIKDQLELERQSIAVEKEKAIAEVEPKMVEIIKNIVQKLVNSQVAVDDTIIYLIKQGFKEIELHGDIIIKVSSEDFEYVIDNKEKLTKDVSERVNLEILKELSLQSKECIIETQMGNIDCSLGTQLNGLLKELQFISDSMTK